jgi:VWFA-related protein
MPGRFCVLAVALTWQVLIGQEQPAFRAGVELVQVDVSVTSKDGRPVTDMTAADFEVLENGKPQVIRVFTPVTIPFDRTELPPVGADRDVQTNTRAPGRVFVFILSDVPSDIALRARFLARQFIERYFAANDVGAVITGRSFPGDRQDFTSNRDLLLAAVDKFAGEGIDEFELADLMETTARIPGSRKVAICFGDLPKIDAYDFIDYHGGVLPSRDDEARHAALSAATRGNIRIYRIDPRGLTPEGGVVVRSGVGDVTGGFDFVNSNEFTSAFERIATETSTYYLLGFESTARRRQGEFIKFEVKAKRPGVTVRSRTGILESLKVNASRMTGEPIRTPVEAALANPIATSGVGMRVVATPYKGVGRNAAVTLTVDLDASQLVFISKDKQFSANLEIRHLATDVNHRIFPEYRHRTAVGLDERSYQRVLASGVHVVSQFELPKGRYQVRVGSASGSANGGVVYDLEVPDFAAAPISLSGLTLTSLQPSSTVTLRPGAVRRSSSRKVEQCRASVCEAAERLESTLVPWKAGGSSSSLLDDVLPAPPTTRREFSSDELVAIYGEIYTPKVTRLATATALLRDKDGATVRELVVNPTIKRASGGVGMLVRMPLDNLPPGEYAIGLRAQSAGEPALSAERLVAIRITEASR